MEEQFLLYEQAVALKELGFKEECVGQYDIKDSNRLISPCIDYYDYDMRWDEKNIEAPLWQQAFDWFDEKHNLIACISTWDIGTYHYTIKNKTGLIYERQCVNIGSFKTKLEARLACLKKLIEIVKKLKLSAEDNQ